MNISELNQLSKQQFSHTLMQCCTCDSWIERLEKCRPFADFNALKVAADHCWDGLAEPDYLQAFDGHPKIGDVNSLKAKYANTKALAQGEQSGVEVASDEVINALSAGNEQYLQQFGFIFIVCATGKSAQQMLTLLQTRLSHQRSDELIIAAEQQRMIFHIRLANLIT